MQKIKKQYVLNEKNEVVAVQIDLRTFEKIEDLLENCILALRMKDVEGEETLTLREAKTHYHTL